MLSVDPTRSFALVAVALLTISATPAVRGQEEDAGHWAFRAPERPAVPRPAEEAVPESWLPLQPLDAFVLERLAAEGLEPSPAAGPRTLIRRLFLDLTGLPPSREQVRRFVADPSEAAYRALVEELLASPRFGEHLARGWLDLVRFADTNGIHHDHFRDQSAYRDWVIRAFNDNLPYDRFVVDQIAGDLHPEPTEAQRIASGFHRLHRIIDVGTALPEESFFNNVVDRVTAVSTAFMGLTAQCAVCHDHKFDPISQAEFYGLYAFFNNIDARPETGRRSGPDFRRGMQPPYLEFPTPEQEEALRRFHAGLGEVQDEVRRLEAVPEAERTEEQAAALESARSERRRLARERDAVRAGVRAAMVMKERDEVRPTYVHVRGDYSKQGRRVERGTPAFLPPLVVEGGVATRMDLARWMVAPDHPLTARVAVNRLWQHVFGIGLVETSEDFGTQGTPPSHPELLDFLAVSFVESGYDVKAMLRKLVTSRTYRQDSAAPTARFVADPDNRLLARGSRYRLDAEVIRDQVLATSGLLNLEMYGPSVKLPQPPGLWQAVALPDSYPRVHRPDPGDAVFRRSVYAFWKRGLPPPQMTILDAPSREACVARRERTNTAQQALLLLNEPEFLRAARHLAARLIDRIEDPDERLEAAYETITCQLPGAEVRDALTTARQDLFAYYREHPELARTLCEGSVGDDAEAAARLAAWTMTVSTIQNLDTTRNRN